MSLLESIPCLGERPFMVSSGRCYTYSDLAREIERLATLLEGKSIRPGQVVAITGAYNFSSAAWFLALAANRCMVVPLVGTAPTDVEARIKEAVAEWVVAGSGSRFDVQSSKLASRECHPLVLRLRETGHAGLILFSSGSTGQAKGMLHDLDRLVGSYPVRKARCLRVLAFMALDHIGGIDTFFRAIASGSCLVVPEERSPEAISEVIEEQGVEVLPATPTFLNLMLLSDACRGRDLSSLKIIGFGAEQMPPAVLHRLQEIFPRVRFQQKFGTSETNAVRTVNKESDPLWMRIDDPAVEWRIVEGELWLKTPSRILGYINHESDRLRADGWYRTGDLVEEDGEGYFRIVARQESTINVGGEKVLPGEVEAVVREVPDVRDCRIFGTPNPLMGEVVGAEIVTGNEGGEKELIRSIRRHCRQQLAPYKVPVKIAVVDEIGMTERFKKRV